MTLTSSNVDASDAKALAPIKPRSWQHSLQLKLQRMKMTLLAGTNGSVFEKFEENEIDLLIRLINDHNHCYKNR